MNTHRANRAINAPFSPEHQLPFRSCPTTVSTSEIPHPRHRHLSLATMSFSLWLLCLFGTLSFFGLPVYVQPSPVPATHTPLVTQGIFSIPLTRLVPRHASSHHYTHVRSSTPLRSPLIEKRTTEAGAVAVPVKAVGRVGYAGNILIGNPPQSITVLFDTGSDLALVISDECQGDECENLTHFSCSSSSTCVDLGGGGGDGSNRRGTKPMTLDSSTLGPEDVVGKVVGGTNSNAGVESGRKADHGRKIKDSTKSEHRATESVVKTHSADKEIVAGQAKMTAPFTARLVGPGVSKIEDRLQRTTNFGNVGGHQSARTQVYSPWSRLYNQSFVDGSWGAGTFVQDRIQVDASPTTDTSSPPSQEPTSARSATVTFLNVVQDNLGLVRGYEGQISGLLGLTRSSATGRKTFLQELVSQGALAMPVMSMRLDLQGGSFMMGGIDPTQYSGELIYGPVTDPVTWQLSLQGLATRARPSPGTDSSSAMPMPHLLPQSNIFQDAPLIIDSGTSSILIPTAASEAIHGELSGTYDPIHRAWFLPCEGPDLVWWISSGQYGVIQPYESLIYPLEDGRCQSLIFENQDADYWILGDTWLRGLYLVYDMAENGRIGIATAIPSSAGAGVGMGAVGESEWSRILAYQETSAGGRSHGDNRWTLAIVSIAWVVFVQTTVGLFP